MVLLGHRALHLYPVLRAGHGPCWLDERMRHVHRWLFFGGRLERRVPPMPGR